MAKPNYAHQKKQREEAARKKREEKLQRRQSKKDDPPPPPVCAVTSLADRQRPRSSNAAFCTAYDCQSR
jgi:hypothetical protein